MSAQFDVSESPLLSEKSKEMVSADEEQFAAQNDVAESLLGLKSMAFEGDKLETVKLSVALQVNFQIESGLDPLIYKEVETSHSNQRRVYRGDIVSAAATALLNGVVSQGSNWQVVRGRR